MQRTDPCSEIQENFEEMHCVKSVQIRSFVCPAFSRIWTESPYLVRIRENTDHIKTSYLDTSRSDGFEQEHGVLKNY